MCIVVNIHDSIVLIEPATCERNEVRMARVQAWLLQLLQDGMLKTCVLLK